MASIMLRNIRKPQSSVAHDREASLADACLSQGWAALRGLARALLPKSLILLLGPVGWPCGCSC